MRIPPSQNVPATSVGSASSSSRVQLVPLSGTRPEEAPERSQRAAATAATRADKANRFSVLNDYRYLTDSDKHMLGEVTGEKIEPGFTDRPGSASAFALQLALDRRTGNLAPHQEVTSVYLRNAAAELQQQNAGRAGYRNPYSGEFMVKAVSWLDAHGRSRADIRM
ncbi:MAG: hypothetical protein IPK37_09135 [Austwickia sp.]|jgi:hypothetical protein|nr:MAG: hypothetical protein IPK37_09135 [Austwickia sp.]